MLHYMNIRCLEVEVKQSVKITQNQPVIHRVILQQRRYITHLDIYIIFSIYSKRKMNAIA